MTAPAFDCDVLVVGLGPVGAALAALLAQQGIATIAIERETAIHPLPRAVHFDHEIMRLFQQLGIAEQVRRHARDLPPYEFRSADGTLLMRLEPAARTPSGWGSGYMFHQPSLEAALRDLLASLPAATTRLGWQLESLAQDADGVTVHVATADGRKTVRARHVVGCDGARSAVREAIGGAMFDYAFDEPWLVVDVTVPPGCPMPQVNLQVCDPARPTTCVLSGPGRHRWEFMLLPGEEPEAMAREEMIRALIAPWNCGPVVLERHAVYRFHGLVASRWRDGRVLIAGDAAHQTPPFAGQGLCAGLRDAVNLAWKLGAVLSGQATDALLDTYQVEREPHVRAMIELAIGMGRVVCTRDAQAAAQRDAAMLARLAAGEPALPPVQPRPLASTAILADSAGAGELLPQPVAGRGRHPLRLDDALGDGTWLICREPCALGAGDATVVDLGSDLVAPFRASLGAWLDARNAAAVLVRPDRYVFGSGQPTTLLAAWHAALHPLPRAA
ncbi:bifunctional 3-(3-hydroxy-phenyl)propionate/3-hydroxycinnamic acid hydroxylase MhpA [Zavarzinia sp. CC-PAN008]|uniref:bifunctional 3-(3-hydroxy-phenyl)propionate/3-hydroxycinnamic acid hydroxylase MhpA n=1 Tax=Zavarzinia sp. CC-PAN008 TaxID=3243332 RepID=UPI003F74A20D